MKEIKVIRENKKEKYEQELTNYISNGFNLLQANISMGITQAGPYYCYFAILMKED